MSREIMTRAAARNTRFARASARYYTWLGDSGDMGPGGLLLFVAFVVAVVCACVGVYALDDGAWAAAALCATPAVTFGAVHLAGWHSTVAVRRRLHKTLTAIEELEEYAVHDVTMRRPAAELRKLALGVAAYEDEVAAMQDRLAQQKTSRTFTLTPAADSVTTHTSDCRSRLYDLESKVSSWVETAKAREALGLQVPPGTAWRKSIARAERLSAAVHALDVDSASIREAELHRDGAREVLAADIPGGPFPR